MNNISKQARIDAAEKFFNLLFGNVNDADKFGYLWMKQEKGGEIIKATYPFKVATPAARHNMAVKAIELNDAGDNVYIGVNLGDNPPADGKRYHKEQVTLQTATIADIDIEGSAHVSKADKVYPPNFDTARAFLPFKPSILVDSGFGLHPYCLYQEPITITTDNRQDCTKRNQNFISVIRSRAGVFSRAVDGVGDLSRVLRVPGTFNYKCGRDNAPLCHVVEVNDVRFTPNEFDDALKPFLPKPATLPRQEAGSSARRTFSDGDEPTTLERLDAMLAVIPPADLSYDEWLNIGMAIHNEGGDVGIWEDWSRADERFKEGECERKFAGFTRNGLTIATVHEIAKRFGYSEKDFQREWHADRRAAHPADENAFDSEQEKTVEDSAVRTANKIKSCPVNLIVPRDFEFSLRGITYIEPPRKEGKPPRRIDVSLTPCVVTRNFVDPVTFKTRCEVAVFIRNKWRTLEFSARTIRDPRQVMELAEYGVDILEPKLLCKFFVELVTENPDIAEIKAYNQTGWVDDDCAEFASPNSDDYVIRREGYDYRKIFTPKGDADTWKEKFSEVMEQGGAPARVAMGIAAASFLVRPLGLINLQCHIHGKRSIGKTPLLKFCVSAFGDANLNGLAYSFGATSPKSRLELACAYRDMPLIAEELESLSAKESEKLPQDIYNFSLGIGGQVLNKNGTLRDAKIFSGARLTSGEHDITNATGNGGELKRVLSLRCATLLEENFAADLHGFCNRNRGHFLQAWIRYITEHRDEIAKDYHKNMTGAKNSQLLGYEHETDATQLSTLIAALTAYQHFKICIGLQDKVNIAELNQDRPDIIARLPTAAEIDDTARAIEFLGDFVTGHERYFFTLDKENKPNTNFTNEQYGIRLDGGTEYAFIPTALKKILEENGFKSGAKLIAEFADRGYLVTNKNRRDHAITVGEKTPKFIHFKAGILARDAEEMEMECYQKLGMID